MIRKYIPQIIALLTVTLGSAACSPAQAPTPREELLRCVPKDFGLCLVINDLRAYAAKSETFPWLKSVKQSPLVQSFLASAELKDLVKFQQDLQKNLDIDWPTLRDDVLGDVVVLAYRPAPPDKPDADEGIVLLNARRPDLMTRLLNNLNRAQKANGELKSLETREHNGTTYTCRIEPTGTHYYMQNGGFFAFTAKEDLLVAMIERKKEVNVAMVPKVVKTTKGDRIIDPRPIIPGKKILPEVSPPVNLLIDHLRRAGSARAMASLWINPRSFDADMRQLAAPGDKSSMLKTLGRYWDVLDGVVVSFAAEQQLEFKLSLMAREKDLPAASRRLFMEPPHTSELWKRFPDNALFAMAGRMDSGEFTDAAALFAPLNSALLKAMQPIAALGDLDMNADIAPNVGPDWGVCVFPAVEPKGLPQGFAALAVRPGTGEVPVDQGLLSGVQSFARFWVFDYNRKHAAEPIRTRTLPRTIGKSSISPTTRSSFPAYNPRAH